MASATLKINRSDRYPVGTVVYAYPKTSRIYSSKPPGTALANATVAADGSLTFSTLNEREQVVLWAEVGGESRYLGVEGPPAAPPPKQTLQQRIAARRTAIGA